MTVFRLLNLMPLDWLSYLSALDPVEKLASYMFKKQVLPELSGLLLECLSLCRHFHLTWWEEKVQQSALYIGTRRSLSTTQRTTSIPQSPSSTTITDLTRPSLSNPSQKTTEQVSCFTRDCLEYVKKLRLVHGAREPGNI